MTDPRIIALINSHPPGGSVICRVAHTENPRRQVNIIYGRERIAALVDLLKHQQTLAQMESALAVVEQDEIRTFMKQLNDALPLAALKKPDR
jgi:hypothetical protein